MLAMSYDNAMTAESSSRPRGAPWLVVTVSLLVLLGRAWRVRAGVPEGAESTLRDYPLDVLSLWLGDSVLLLLLGAAFTLAPLRAPEGSGARLGWAWACWTALVGCVPPREGNFWASGGVDDALLVYLPLVLLALALTWVQARNGFGWVDFAGELGLLSVAGAGLLVFEGGHGLAGVVSDAQHTAVAAGAVAVGLAVIGRLKR